jgi:hypothetical protein
MYSVDFKKLARSDPGREGAEGGFADSRVYSEKRK